MSWSTVRVPASSANLGPGFDALGVALSVYLDCRFRASERLSIAVTGRDAAAISTGEDNLIWQTALSVAADVRMQLPPIELVIDNQIPLGKGLGSSAAALTAGVVIADRLLGLGWRPATPRAPVSDGLRSGSCCLSGRSGLAGGLGAHGGERDGVGAHLFPLAQGEAVGLEEGADARAVPAQDVFQEGRSE